MRKQPDPENGEAPHPRFALPLLGEERAWGRGAPLIVCSSVGRGYIRQGPVAGPEGHQHIAGADYNGFCTVKPGLDFTIPPPVDSFKSDGPNAVKPAPRLRRRPESARETGAGLRPPQPCPLSAVFCLLGAHLVTTPVSRKPPATPPHGRFQAFHPLVLRSLDPASTSFQL